MIVCICQGVGCRTVREAIRDGALTADAVGEACGAGTDCGSCRGMIEDMIEDAVTDGLVARDAQGRTHLGVRRTAA